MPSHLSPPRWTRRVGNLARLGRGTDAAPARCAGGVG